MNVIQNCRALFFVLLSVVSIGNFPAHADEIRVISRRPNNNWLFLIGGDISTGHALIARFDDNGKLKESGGTVSYWPGMNLKYDHEWDRSIANGNYGPRGSAVRIAKVTSNRADWIMNNVARNTGCGNYFAAPPLLNTCNCVTFSQIVWYTVTANREYSFATAPEFFASKISGWNAKGQWLDNGNRW